jgi:hypothetical protein
MAAPLSLPAEGIYTSLEAAKTAISLHSMSAGYALVIGKNDIKKGRRVIQTNCKRFGKEKARINEEYRRCHRYTVKYECLFSIRIREQTDSSWIVQHREGQHIAFIITNRRPLGPFLSIELTRDQTALIETNYASGIPASRTIAVLRREDPSINIIKRDTYNTTADLSRAKRQRKSPPEALIDRFETEKAEGKTHFEWRRDAEGHIAMLFIDLLPTSIGTRISCC